VLPHVNSRGTCREIHLYSNELVEQSLRILKIGSAEAFRKVGIDCCETVTRLLSFASLGY
jgi:hypothetical protein